jgi:hypothetical protein
MASIGNLVVNLTAKTDKFRKGMASAQQTVNKMAAATVALGAVATARLAAVGDLFDKMALRTGVTVEELSRFKFAAEQSGASIQVMEKGLKTMSVLMLNSERGMSTAVDTMNDLGISAAQLAGKTQTARFGIFADAIGKIQDPARRTAQAVAVFGRAGAELLPLILGGADAMRQFAAESDALGNTVSRTEATVGANLTDSFNRFKVAVDGAFRKIALQFGPALVKVVDKIAHGIAGVSRFEKDIVILGGAVIAAAIAMRGVTLATQAYTKAVAIAQALSGPAGWKTLAIGVIAATAATVALNEAFKDTGDSLTEASVATGNGVDAMAALESSADGASGAISELAALATQFQNSMQSLESPVNAVSRQVAEFREQLEAAQTGIVWDRHPLVEAMREKESGFTTMLSNLQNELKILRGEATETGIKLAQMAEMGVDPAQIEKLRKLFAERDAILAKSKAADEWRNSIGKGAGVIAGDTAVSTQVRKDGLTPSHQRGTTEALTAIMRSVRPGGKTAEVAVMEKVEKATNHQSEILQKGFDKITAEKENMAVQGAIA